MTFLFELTLQTNLKTLPLFLTGPDVFVKMCVSVKQQFAVHRNNAMHFLFLVKTEKLGIIAWTWKVKIEKLGILAWT